MKLIISFLFVIFYLNTFSQDTIVVQIVHGSKPRKGFNDEIKTVGGKKGGHVVVQIDQYVYGFHPLKKRIHIFSHKKKNSIFQTPQSINQSRD